MKAVADKRTADVTAAVAKQISEAEARIASAKQAALDRIKGVAAETARDVVAKLAGLSPDALTGMEASLRFSGPETLETKIFGRLSAWQNWVFGRPNAVGDKGALKLFGTGAKARFDWERV